MTVTNKSKNTIVTIDADSNVVHKTGNETIEGNKTITGQLDGNIKLNIPQGRMLNGKIVTSVSGGALTVAVKTLAGNDPSASDPIYVRIGNGVRTLASAKSIIEPAGVASFNSSSLELQNQEVDYFVYLAWDNTLGIQVGVSRIPYARTVSDFTSGVNTEKYCDLAYNNYLVGTTECEVVGRFNAILSNTNTWSIPATSVIINRPVYNTRRLTYAPQGSASGGGFSIGNGSIEGAYSLNVRNVSISGRFNFGSTTNIGTGQLSFTIPFQNNIDTLGLQLRTLGGGSGAAYNGTSYPLTPVTNFYNNNGGVMLATPNTTNSGFLGAGNPFTWATTNYAGWGWSYDLI